MTIQKRPTSDGKRIAYVVRFRVQGVQKSKSFRRLADARKFDIETYQSIHESKYIDPKAGRITLETFANQWLDAHTVSPATRAKYRSLLDAQIIPGLGHLVLEALTPLAIKQFVSASPLAPSSVRSIVSLLTSLALAAIEDKRINQTFMPSRMALPRERADARIFLNVDQVRDLVDAAKDRDKALIFTAAWTGMRWGEIVGLKRERLDLDRRVLEVREALVDVEGIMVMSVPKTPGSSRNVRLTDLNVEVLRHHIETYPPGDMGLVFSTNRGKPIRDDNWRKRTWKPLVASVASVPDGCRFHDLRHTHVAISIDAGLSLKAIQVRLGHSSIRVTGDRYAHLLDSVLDRDMDSLNAL